MKAKVRQLRAELKSTKKGTKSVSEYVLRIKAIYDSLVSIGDSITEQDQIDAILEGLPEEYGPFIMLIYSRTDSPSVTDLESLLMVQEAQLQKFKPEVNTGVNSVSVNVTQNSQAVKNNFSESQDSGYDKGGRSSRGRGRNNNRGRGRGRYGSGPKPTCQICFKYGHAAFDCWSRFDQNFVQPEPPPPQAHEQAHPYSYHAPQYQQGPPQYQQGPPQSQQAAYHGPRPPPNQNYQNQPRAYLAAQSNVYQPVTQELQVPSSLDTNWYPDSGATHHVTPDASQFSQQSPYSGSE